MNQFRFPTSTLLIVLLSACFSGCAYIAASGDINDGSAENASAQDNDARMRRMREGGTLRPGEYDALRDKMGDGKNGEVAPKPSVEELEQRVEAGRRKLAEPDAGQ